MKTKYSYLMKLYNYVSYKTDQSHSIQPQCILTMGYYQQNRLRTNLKSGLTSSETSYNNTSSMAWNTWPTFQLPLVVVHVWCECVHVHVCGCGGGCY